MKRLLRLVILGPCCLVIVPIIMFLEWATCGDGWWWKYPRWTWQLLWYGADEAEHMP